jgi:exosome complex component CSL4
MKEKIVLPGEFLGTVEEFLLGEGTFEKDGKIYSKILGRAEYKPKERTVKVIPINKPPTLKEQDIILGSIIDIKEHFIVVEILGIVGKKRELAHEKIAALHISKVAKRFVLELAKMFKINDIIRAVVLKSKPQIQLSTVGIEFGVIKAYCSSCRRSLKFKAGKLFCDYCKRIEERKIAKNYYGKGFA